MAQTDIRRCTVVVLFILTTFINAAYCHEPKNDLLSGEDFLSLLIGRGSKYRVSRKRVSHEDSFLPLEDLFLTKESQQKYKNDEKEYKTEEPTTIMTTELPEEVTTLTPETNISTTTLKIINEEKLTNMTVVSVHVSSSVKEEVKVTHRRKHDRKLSTTVSVGDDDNNTEGDSFTDSSNVHSIIAAPEQLQFESKSRMQRKQDDASSLPYQTLIHHNDQGSISFTAVDLKSERQQEKNINNDSGNEGSNAKKGKLFPFFDGIQTFSEPSKFYSEPAKFYSEPSKVYGEPSKFYSEPSRIYSEPEKIYSEPSKFYSEPSKVYGEPAKFYSEPSKVYGEPSKVYSHPSWDYKSPLSSTTTTTTTSAPASTTKSPIITSTSVTITTSTSKPHTVFNEFHKIPYDKLNAPVEDESHAGNGDEDDSKFGYVVEGRNYRKYRVEEKTSDGFIVGEYGVLSHNDGSLRGVRYTADSNINPRLIQDALLKFLSL